MLSVLVALASTALAACSSRPQQRPPGIFDDSPPDSLLSTVQRFLPTNGHPDPTFLLPSVDPNLHFLSQGYVTVTFLYEGAGYHNTLGYFLFDDRERILSTHTIFPDVTADSIIRYGDSLRLGPFPAGTNLGFYLIGNGWNDQFWCANLAGQTYYTLDQHNPDGLRHIALVRDSITGKLIIGFEDLFNLGDRDYEDAVFISTVEGDIETGTFPIVMLVTTPEDTPVRFSLQSEVGEIFEAEVRTLPNKGSLYQANSDGSRGAKITALGTGVPGPFQLWYQPRNRESGVPYTNFVCDVRAEGGFFTIQVRIDVTAVARVPTALPQTINVVAGQTTVVDLEGDDAGGFALTAFIHSLPSAGALTQMQTNAPIPSGGEVRDALMKLQYTSSDPYIDAPRSDSFRFKVDNAAFRSSAATVTVNISPRPNTKPTANNIGTVSVAEDGQKTIELGGTDPEGDPLSVRITSVPARGTLYQTSDGSTRGARINNNNDVLFRSNKWRVIYVPPPNEFGNAFTTFRYDVRDPRDDSNDRTVTINVTPVNDRPTATAGSDTVLEDSVLNTLTLSGTDIETPTNQLQFRITSLVPASKGTLYFGGAPVTVNQVITSRNLQFTPTPLTYGTTSFKFRARDADGGQSNNQATFTINVQHVNHAPTASASPSAAVFNEDGFVDVTLRGNDVDGDSLQVTVTRLPSTFAGATFRNGGSNVVQGRAENLPAGGFTVRFTPPDFVHGSDSFEFTVTDGEATTAPITVPITVRDVNHNPALAISPSGATVDVLEDDSVTLSLSATDVDIPAEDLSFRIVSVPARGKLVRGSTVSGPALTSNTVLTGAQADVTFIPDPLTFGNAYASFEVRAEDSAGGRSANRRVTFDVEHVNHPPAVTASENPVVVNQAIPKTFQIRLLDDDVQDTLEMRISAISGRGGQLRHNAIPLDVDSTIVASTLAARVITLEYVPPDTDNVNDDTGEDFFTFSVVVTDPSEAASLTVSMDILIVLDPPSGRFEPPVFAVPEDQGAPIDLIGSHPELDNNLLTIELTSLPAEGTLYFATAQGGQGAEVTGQLPLELDQSGGVVELYYRAPVAPEGVSLGPNNAAFQFSVTAQVYDEVADITRDESVVVTVPVSVTDVNYPPVAPASIAESAAESLDEQLIEFTLTATDPDNDVLSMVLTALPGTGSVVQEVSEGVYEDVVADTDLAGAGGVWTVYYRLAPLTHSVPISFSYQARDPSGEQSAVGTATLTVADTEFAPTASADPAPAELDEDTSVEVTLSAQDFDTDETFTIAIVEAPGVGDLTEPADTGSGDEWTVTYTPPLYTFGDPLAAFSFVVTDSTGRDSDEVSVSLVVNHVNHAPVALEPESPVCDENSETAPIELAGTDVDRIDTLVAVVTSLPDDGELLDGGTRDPIETVPYVTSNPVIFVPPPFESGDEYASFTFRVRDDGPGTLESENEVTVTIDVTDINYAPLVLQDSFVLTTDENVPVELVVSVPEHVRDPDGDDVLLVVETATTDGVLSDVATGQVLLESSTVAPNGDGDFVLLYTPSFNPPVDSFGSPFDSFTLRASDSLLLSDDAAEVTVNVLDFNFAPNATDLSATTLEDEPVNITMGATVSDIDEDTVTVMIESLPELATLVYEGTEVGDGDLPFALTGNREVLLFVPDQDATGAMTFDYYAEDDGSPSKRSESFTVTVDVVPNSVPIPLLAEDYKTTPETTDVGFELGGIDIDDDPITAIITAIPTRGKLYQSLADRSRGAQIVEVGTPVTQQSPWRVIFEPFEYRPENEDHLDTFAFNVIDEDHPEGSESLVATVNVTDVNFPPVASFSPDPVTTAEATDVVITLSGADFDQDLMTATITALPPVGTLFEATADGTIVAEITEIGNLPGRGTEWHLVYRPPPRGYGRNFSFLFFRLSDGRQDSPDLMVTISVFGVNEEPTVTGPESFTTASDVDDLIPNVVVDDPDAEGFDPQNFLLQITLDSEIDGSSVYFATSVGLTAALDAEGAPLTNAFVGSLAAMREAVPQLAYRSAEGYIGDDVITITVNDLGNFGSGGPMEAALVIPVNVLPPTDDDSTAVPVPMVAGAAAGIAAFVGAGYAGFKKSGGQTGSLILPPDVESFFSSNPLYEASGNRHANPLYGESV